MITVRKALAEELPLFHTLEQQEHAKPFINATSLQEHQDNFLDPAIYYLSIDRRGVGCVGFFILALEKDADSVEFRRVIVDARHRGIGQRAIALMEAFCIEQLGVSRIWLDVYADNVVGMHVYEKLNYQRFSQAHVGSRVLYFYEKPV